MQQPVTFVKSIFFALMTVSLMYGIYYLNPPQSSPIQVKNGVIDISKVLNEHNSINLNGKWLFFYNELLSDEQITSRLTSQLNEQTYINVPGNWKPEKFDKYADPGKSYGTYHLQIKAGKRTSPLAIKLPRIGTAYRIYLNQKLLSSVGKVGSSKEKTQGQYKPQVVLLETSDEVFNLTLHVANYERDWGVILYPLQIGNVQTIFQEQKFRAMKTLFISGFFFAAAIYSLLLFSLHTSDKLSLIFTLICIILGVRELVMQDAVILNYLADLNITQLVTIEYTAFFLAVPLACHFIYLNYPRFFDKRVLISSYVISLLLTTTLIIGGLEASYQVLVLMQLISPIYIAYALWIVIKACLSQQKKTVTIIAGTVLFAFCVINDILFSQALISTGYITSYGLLLFVITQNYMTGVNLMRSFQRSEALSIKLKKRNLILDNLRLSLANQVKERTHALAEANQYLQKIAHTDALTDVPNRHGIQSIIEHEQSRFKRSAEVYSVLVIDLDLFKKINDQFGHDAGDEVLKTCAQVIKHGIRQQDAFARWGGEEFIILLPTTNLEGAMNLAEKIRQAIAQSVIQFNGHEIQITCTIGVSEIQLNEDFEQAFKRADQALFTAKEQGRNQVIAGNITNLTTSFST
ncbi:MAG: diguanylate cyclase (GGDEF)-like protein [Moritella sp.]|jgi:diguanylate cyclase (GGDEF)-like protein